MIIVSIYDQVSETFGNPVVAPSLSFVKREISNLVRQNPDHIYGTNSSDFEIVVLGDFEPRTALNVPTHEYNPIVLSNVCERIDLSSFLRKDVEDGDQDTF